MTFKSPFKCKPLCGACCGLVPIDAKVYERNKGKIQDKIERVLPFDDCVIPLTKSGKCCFLNPDKRCLIYADRPSVCKEYGLNDRLPCPYYNFKGEERDSFESLRFLIRINREVDETLTKLGERMKK